MSGDLENQLQINCQAMCQQQEKGDETSCQETSVFLLEFPHETLSETHFCDFALAEHNDYIQSPTNIFVFDSSTSRVFPLYISSSLCNSHHSDAMNVFFSPVAENTLHPNINNPVIHDDTKTNSQSVVTSLHSESILYQQEMVNMGFVVPSAEASPSAADVYNQNLLECLLEHQDSDDLSEKEVHVSNVEVSMFSEEEENVLQNAYPLTCYTEPFEESNLLIKTIVPSFTLQQEPAATSNISILNNALSFDMFPEPCPTLLPIEENAITRIALTSEATLLLGQQLRKHVQLLTQMHLITAQQSALAFATEECRTMIQDLLPLKQRMEIANLDEALELVTYWETIVTKTPPEKLVKFERTVVTSGEKKKFFKRTSKHPRRCPFNSKMVEIMAHSHVFIYPELLPRLAIFQSEPGPCMMSLHEEQLIAMGMEQFTPFCTELLKDELKVSSKDNLVYSMISDYMLPHWTAKQIATRIKNKSFKNKRNKSESNPIKYYRRNKVAPPIHHNVQPFDRNTTVRLCDVPLHLLPERWQEMLSKISNAPCRHCRQASEPFSSHQKPQITCLYQQDEAQPVMKQILCELTILLSRGEWGKMAVEQNAQIDFLCNSIALAT